VPTGGGRATDRTPLDRQMDMVAHQAEGQDPEAEPPADVFCVMRYCA
jgi:hypothetical protein